MAWCMPTRRRPTPTATSTLVSWDVFDLQRGHVVTVSDGMTTKTHTVANLFVDGVDVTGDDRVRPGRCRHQRVDVWVHDDGGLTVTADGLGGWTCRLLRGDRHHLLSQTAARNRPTATVTPPGIWWASPRFQVVPVDDWVQSSSPWTPEATISLTIEDGSGVVYSDFANG